jgi:hypothetical protein
LPAGGVGDQEIGARDIALICMSEFMDKMPFLPKRIKDDV